MVCEVPFRDIVQYAISGGWGKDKPFEGSIPVVVIRGTDFANIESRKFSELPHRYEDCRKAERRFLQPEDIIIEISGGSPTSKQSTGRSFFVTQRVLKDLGNKVIPATFCRLVRIKSSSAYPRYVFYILQEMYKSGRARFYEHQSTGISNFQFEFFLDNELIRLPPLSEQRAIAHMLGTLDDKIELNRRMNETLEQMARALFKAWFVDFEPVRAKMEGRWKRGQSLPGMPAHLYNLFPDRLVDSEIGKIPEGWEVQAIGEAVKVVGGGTPSTKENLYWDGGIHPFCTPKDMSNLKSFVLLETERHLTDEGIKKISSGKLPRGTVLLSSRAPIGYLAIAEIPVSINQGIIAMICDGALPNLYVLFWTQMNMDRIESNANGSTFQEISKKNFRPIPIIVPPRPVLNAFMAAVQPLYERLLVNVKETRTLIAMRDNLLPKLISGEIRVKELAQKFHLHNNTGG